MSSRTQLRPALVALRCRTSDRDARLAAGVDALADALAQRLGAAARAVGAAAPPVTQPFDQDLADSRGCLLEAGGQVQDALAGGELPVLVAGDCSIALTTLPTVARERPDAKVLWLDAHGDFHTPDTTPSRYLGGMCLAGACGRWDAGLSVAALAPERVVLCGVRALDEGEGEALSSAGVTVIGPSLETLVYLQNALDGAAVHVHLDVDVLDAGLVEVTHPSEGGLSAERLYDLLDAVSDSCEVVGVEVAGLAAEPGDDGASADLVAEVVGALLPQEVGR